MYQSENQTDLMPAATFSSLTFSLWRLEEEDKHGCVFFFYCCQVFCATNKICCGCRLPVFSLYNTTQGAESNIYSAFHQHQREPLSVSTHSAFPQTNKPAAFFKFMFSSCCRGSSCVFPIKYTDVYLVNHPAGR